jgi:ATP-dependent 26S proteasome regulatory subunit
MTSKPQIDPVNELIVLVRSRLYLVALDTPDPARGYEAAALAASQLTIPIFIWTRTKGIKRRGEPIAAYGTTAFKEALAHIEQARLPAIWYFENVGKDLDDPTNVQALRDTIEVLRDTDGLIVLADGATIVPDSLKSETAVLKLPTPTKADYVAAINRIMLRLQARVKVKSTLSQADTDRLVAALGGFTISEAERMITKVAMDDGTLAAGDIATVISAKYEQLKARGLLEFCTVDVTLADVVGLSSLKEWLGMRRAVIADPLGAAAAGLPFPKGMLLVGVPGCGKSMCAKAVAADWGLPLLRMDTSGLFDKYVGESEKRFLGALDVAQRAAPCILWIDEIEKAFSSGDDSDGGVSLRVLGTFLSWLQDRKGDVFVVATANNIDRLPPEAVRKGRFDEIFFVDLPGQALRESIFRAHIAKRAKAGTQFDSAALAQCTEGFSGAEIEQAVVSAAYAAFAKKQPLDQAGILAEVERTVPLSRTMPERVRDIRAWANGRAAPAGS